MCSKNNISLIRYVDVNAAKSIIHANSTFLLRSLQYYQDLEIYSNDKTRGDRKEGEVEFLDGSVSIWNPEDWLISCWCIYEGIELNWELFDDNIGLAIISTSQKVKSMLDKACSSINHLLEDKEVIYENKLANINKSHMHLDDYDPYFYKRRKFMLEKEYRFALHLPLHIETLILYVNPYDYIDQICVKPDKRIKKCINYYILCAEAGYGSGTDFDWRGKLTRPLL